MGAKSSSCDLSKISYLCTDIHTCPWWWPRGFLVVICRKFLIFAQTFTPSFRCRPRATRLWFVENFLSLHRQSHLCSDHSKNHLKLWFVENFLSLHRQSHLRENRFHTSTCCDLSKISYLCTDNHTLSLTFSQFRLVVICRKFLIFAQTITPERENHQQHHLLWFVENFLSLHRQSHPRVAMLSQQFRCDLSKISYLCTDNHT